MVIFCGPSRMDRKKRHIWVSRQVFWGIFRKTGRFSMVNTDPFFVEVVYITPTKKEGMVTGHGIPMPGAVVSPLRTPN